MNLEHYKAASERTDADERALIPAIKRTAPRTASERVYREVFTIDEVLLKYQELKAHADKLAEALRDLTKRVDALEGQEIEYALAIALAKSCIKAKSDLAAYEAAQ